MINDEFSSLADELLWLISYSMACPTRGLADFVLAHGVHTALKVWQRPPAITPFYPEGYLPDDPDDMAGAQAILRGR